MSEDKIATQLAADKKTLNDILDGWSADAVISDKEKASPQDVIAGIGKLHAKYLKILSNHTLNAKEIMKEYAKVRKLRVAYYDGSISKEQLDEWGWEPYLGPAPRIKSSMEALLDADDYLIAVMERKHVYEEIVKACEYIIKEIGNRTWQLREFMQWERQIRNA